jgi:hypothetical protein
MKHPDYEDVLGVGCICAGHMENDLVHAKKRDDFMKSRANKRKKWLNRNWKKSAKGNDYIKTDGYVIVMKRNKNHAKLAAFDYLTKILADKS